MKNIDILFEDESLLVIHKPPGMVVNKAESVLETTVQEWVEERYEMREVRSEILKDETENSTKTFYQRAGIAHRLDKETSGALVIAKNADVLQALMHQFQERKVQKEYIALVHGSLKPREGWFKVPIKRKGVRLRRFGVDPLGKPSETHYRVEGYYRHEQLPLTLVRLYPKTGRTHQLRVHLSFYKHPLVADALYASAHLFQTDSLWCPRHFLHALSINFIHPVKRVWLRCQAPLPTDLTTVMDTLESNMDE